MMAFAQSKLSEHTPHIIGITLTLISFVLTPRIGSICFDNPTQYIFYYAKTLPLIYYIALAYNATVAVLGKRRGLKLLLVLNTALLVELTPSLMLANPWLPDQYPYLAEAAWLTKYGHITDIHYLNEVPGLGLMFSQLMLITNLGPFNISKLYPCLTSLALVLPLYILCEKLSGNGALAPLLFLSINWTQVNTFHRATYFFILFSILILTIIKMVTTQTPSVYIIVNTLLFSAMVLTYPGTVIILTMLLATIATLRVIEQLNKEQNRTRRYGLFKLFLIFSIIFLSWNLWTARGEFSRLIGNTYGALNELISLSTPMNIEPRHSFSQGLTSLFRIIIYIRVIKLGFVVILGIFGSLYSLKLKKTTPIFVAAFYTGIVLSIIIFAPTTWNQWYLSKFNHHIALLASLCTGILIADNKHKNFLKYLILIFISINLLTVPVLRYASIPYLHVTTQELKAIEFVHIYYEESAPIYYEEYPPYILPRLLLDKDISWDIQGSGAGFIPLEPEVNFLTSQRLITRDGYYIHPIGGYKKYLDSRIKLLTETHNLVYASGTYTKLFVVIT